MCFPLSLIGSPRSRTDAYNNLARFASLPLAYLYHLCAPPIHWPYHTVPCLRNIFNMPYPKRIATFSSCFHIRRWTEKDNQSHLSGSLGEMFRPEVGSLHPYGWVSFLYHPGTSSQIHKQHRDVVHYCCNQVRTQLSERIRNPDNVNTNDHPGSIHFTGWKEDEAAGKFSHWEASLRLSIQPVLARLDMAGVDIRKVTKEAYHWYQSIRSSAPTFGTVFIGPKTDEGSHKFAILPNPSNLQLSTLRLTQSASQLNKWILDRRDSPQDSVEEFLRLREHMRDQGSGLLPVSNELFNEYYPGLFKLDEAQLDSEAEPVPPDQEQDSGLVDMFTNVSI